MSSIASPPSRVLNLSVRESRLIVDRILLTLDLPSGFIAAVRDVILTSQALGAAGFLGLSSRTRLADIRSGASRLATLVSTVEKDTLLVQADELHAWLALPTWLDLIVAQTRRSGLCTSYLNGVLEANELAAVPPLAQRYGVVATCETDSTGAKVTARLTRAAESEHWNPCLHAALRQGFDVPETAWWPLYEASKKALSPDSVTSRRHAGPTIVADDGSLIGRPPADDDTDLSLLRQAN